MFSNKKKKAFPTNIQQKEAKSICRLDGDGKKEKNEKLSELFFPPLCKLNFHVKHFTRSSLSFAELSFLSNFINAVMFCRVNKTTGD